MLSRFAPEWQKRYYDRNVRDEDEFKVKLRYLHRNPVKRGLVTNPADWKWSSFRHYALREVGTVEIESQWTASDRETKISGRRPRLFLSPGSRPKGKREPGAPGHVCAPDTQTWDFWLELSHLVGIVCAPVVRAVESHREDLSARDASSVDDGAIRRSQPGENSVAEYHDVASVKQ